MAPSIKSGVGLFLGKTPFLRLLIALIMGIILQWYGQWQTWLSICLMLSGAAWLILYRFFSLPARFRWRTFSGICLHMILVGTGMLLVVLRDVRNQGDWFGRHYQTGSVIKATLSELPVQKKKSWKAGALVYAVYRDNREITVGGKIVIYFRSDFSAGQLKPGDQIIFKKELQEIKKSGNPGGFDYRQFSLFRGITHQVYLVPGDFLIMPEKKISFLQNLLYQIRIYVLSTLKRNLPGKKEQGLAEALLIGYRDDLDKSLLQSYTNTGVVHIIAVSGMHLASLYWVLNLLISPLLRFRAGSWLHPLIVLLILWIFTLVTGGEASIVRAAVMFSFIKAGKIINRNASIYNILAASAFCLLCFNPFFLWDVGFQLSYSAVLSIVVFFKPLYNLLSIRNKALDWFWQLVAVSLAAQILTSPLSIYHFHQFPVYFLLTNLLAVPVSTVILIGEVALTVVAPIGPLARVFGKVLNGLIWWLNSFIERIETFPFALWDGLQINIVQTVLLYFATAFLGFWLIQKTSQAVWPALIAMVSFVIIRWHSFAQAGARQQIIVYQVPRYQAVDFVRGRDYYFMGDTALLSDVDLCNYYLRPTRIQNRLSDIGQALPALGNKPMFLFAGKSIMIINQDFSNPDPSIPLRADIAIVSGNPPINLRRLPHKPEIGQIVLDGSVPRRKSKSLREDCDWLGIACHDVNLAGAFVLQIR